MYLYKNFLKGYKLFSFEPIILTPKINNHYGEATFSYFCNKLLYKILEEEDDNFHKHKEDDTNVLSNIFNFMMVARR